MSSNRLELVGMAELRDALRKLPTALKQQAGPIVVKRANNAKAQIVADYPDVTGKLKQGVKVQTEESPFGTAAIVKSTAKHAFIFENGTQARHTDLGYNRGAMPPGNVFVPAVVRERRAMVDELIALVEREGLVVSGR